MAADGMSGIAAGAGIKAVLGMKGSLMVLLAAIAVSTLAVVAGFTVIPLKRGHEMRDATRRLACGLLSSFTLGPIVSAYVAKEYPWYTAHIAAIVGDQVLGFIAAMAPFVAVSGLVGFWLVAAVMRWLEKRKNKDIVELARDASQDRTAFSRTEY